MNTKHNDADKVDTIYKTRKKRRSSLIVEFDPSQKTLNMYFSPMKEFNEGKSRKFALSEKNNNEGKITSSEVEEVIRDFTINLTSESKIDKFIEENDSIIGNINYDKEFTSVTGDAYLDAFVSIIDFVEQKTSHLFYEEELNILKIFRRVSISSSILFSRLFARKNRWFDFTKINLKNVSDIELAVSELVEMGLMEIPSRPQDVLPYFSNKELRTLLKGTKNKRNKDLIKEAIDWYSTQRVITGDSLVNMKFERYIGIKESVLEFFRLVFNVFYLNPKSDISLAILSKLNIIKFANYIAPDEYYIDFQDNFTLLKSIKTYNIFNDRQVLDEYNKACKIAIEFSNLTKQELDLENHSTHALDRKKQQPNCKHLKDNKDIKIKVFGIISNILLEFENELNIKIDSNNNVASSPTTNQDSTVSDVREKHITTNSIKITDYYMESRNGINEIIIGNKYYLLYNGCSRYEFFLKSNAENKTDTINLNFHFDLLEIKKGEGNTFNDCVLQDILLNRYTKTWVYSGIIWSAIKVLENLKEYNIAINCLKALLSQDRVNNGRRGDCWIRLTTDLKHIGEIKEAIEICGTGLLDPHCRPHHVLILHKKYETLIKNFGSIQKKLSSNRGDKGNKCKLQKINKMIFEVVPSIRFESPIMNHGMEKYIFTESYCKGKSFKSKSFYINYGNQFFSVEELTLQHYKAVENWPKGIHCEGSAFLTIYGLIFWDIIFDASIPYVFQNPYQDAPLDLTLRSFYLNRKTKIESRLSEITSFDGMSLIEKKLRHSYENHYNCLCRGVSWDWKVEELIEILKCMSGQLLNAIMKRFALDYRFTHSGLPDLLLWDPNNCKCKLVEVKGPNDKLSEKQIVWIDYLIKAGCDVEVAYVKIKPTEGENSDVIVKVEAS